MVETPAAMEQLIDEISQLGHVPRAATTASTTEQKLYGRLYRARTACSLTIEQEAALDRLAQASGRKVVQQVRDLGHYPKASAGRSLAERQLAWKLRTALKAEQISFSPEQEADLQALPQASPEQEVQAVARTVEEARKAEELMQQVRDFGRYPKESKRGDGGASQPALSNEGQRRARCVLSW